MTIRVRRVYDSPSRQDGYRVLVDRLWPRGVSQAMGQVDLWLRDLAPTTELRQWYGHETDRWPEFQARYREELAGHAELLDLLLDIEQHRKTVTLLFGARDEERNEAQVVAEVLKGRPRHSHH
ncbi:MAG TPA: DUF488 family protein [Candidatus Limnocylindrales bacterium]|nr:DUF488 family protein [Candidatus Limnocylindrales bacterium]